MKLAAVMTLSDVWTMIEPRPYIVIADIHNHIHPYFVKETILHTKMYYVMSYVNNTKQKTQT